MFFILSKKIVLFSRYWDFFIFFPFFWPFLDLKGQMEMEQFMSWIDFHKFADVAFEITQKTVLHYIIKLDENKIKIIK